MGEAGAIHSQTMPLAIGINRDGRRGVLAVELAQRENRSSWREFLLGLPGAASQASRFCSPTITPGSAGEPLPATDQRPIMRSAFALVALLGLLILAALASFWAWQEVGEVAIGLHGWIALGLGVVLTFLVGAGLMALMFFSARRGYDERAQEAERTPADHWREGAGRPELMNSARLSLAARIGAPRRGPRPHAWRGLAEEPRAERAEPQPARTPDRMRANSSLAVHTRAHSSVATCGRIACRRTSWSSSAA